MHLTDLSSVAFTLWKSDLRHFIVLFNIIALLAIAGYLAWTVFSRKQVEKVPANRKRFLSDDDLEGRRLERVLAWSLVFVTIFAVVMLVYLVREPARQDESEQYFEDGTVERGAVLFAGPESEDYNSVLSLQCANCHGSEGGGGSTTQVIDPDGPDGEQPPETHTWAAPALNTELLRFSPEEVEQVITYGRPGTPMAAFGVAGGGAKNEQTIRDLVAFIESIQLSPDEARAEAEDAIETARNAASEAVTAAQQASDEATATLTDDRQAVADALGATSATTDDELVAECDALEGRLESADEADEAEVAQGEACRTFLTARDAVEAADAKLAWAEAWRDSRTDVSDGQLLFETYCARCHTQGWSIFDPTEPNGTRVLGLPGGGGGQGGGIGFNLRDGATTRRFGPGAESGTLGFDAQVEFIRNGSVANEQYGNGGIGSGRMPGFADMLTDEMIEQIVAYERNDLDATTYLAPAPTTASSGATATSGTTTTTGG